MVVVGALALAGVAGASSQSNSVRVRIDQEGLPKDGYEEGALLNSRTTASGAVVVKRPLATTSFATQRVATRGPFVIDHVDTLSVRIASGELGRRVVRLELHAEKIRLASFADGTHALRFTARVVSSNDPACPVGSVGPMLISDDGAGIDAVRMVLCPYVHEHYFEQGLRGRLRVTIG